MTTKGLKKEEKEKNEPIYTRSGKKSEQKEKSETTESSRYAFEKKKYKDSHR